MIGNKTVLLVEDNEKLNNINKQALELSGYEVLTARNLAQARKHLSEKEPGAIILDIMLPDGHGVDFCREIRSHTAAPILFLSALKGYEQTIAGLKAGGDDYLTKPFDLDMLIAKIEAFMRRDIIRDQLLERGGKPATGTVIQKGRLSIDTTAAQAYLNNENIALSQKEYALLMFLFQNENTFISGDKIYQSVWHQPLVENDNSLKNMISRLRKKIEGSGYEIVSERGSGYQIKRVKSP